MDHENRPAAPRAFVAWIVCLSFFALAPLLWWAIVRFGYPAVADELRWSSPFDALEWFQWPHLVTGLAVVALCVRRAVAVWMLGAVAVWIVFLRINGLVKFGGLPPAPADGRTMWMAMIVGRWLVAVVLVVAWLAARRWKRDGVLR